MLDCITIGSATRDVFIESSAMKLIHDPKHLADVGIGSPDAECVPLGAKLEIQRPHFTCGGGAANAAVTFARQGFSVSSFIGIGNDEIGQAICRTLEQEGVRVDSSVSLHKGSAYSTILLAASGERTIFVYRGASEDLSVVSFSEFPRFAYIVPGHIDPSILIPIVHKLHEARVKLVINPSRFYLTDAKSTLFEMLPLMDIVLMNREEGSVFTSIPEDRERDIFATLDKLVSGIIVLTDGPRGALVSDGSSIYRSGVFPQTVIDRTGAGDAFGSGFTFGVMSGTSISEALRIGTANATSVVGAYGAQAGILRSQDLSNPRFSSFSVNQEVI